jgi:uncharacterized membrane protein
MAEVGAPFRCPSLAHGSLLALASVMEREVLPYSAPESAEPGWDSTDGNSERRRRRLVVNRAFGAIKSQRAADRSWVETIAERLNDFAASTSFLVIHALWFVAWVLWNTGTLGLRPFDPFPFGLLTMVVSLEAIFLSIFVLLAQKREAAIAELREEMSLQVALRLEEEVTKTLQLVAGLYTRLGHKVGEDPELHEMLQPLDVERIERELILQIATARQTRRADSD